MLTCDLTDSEVVSSSTIRVPGCALDKVVSPCFKVIKGHCGVSGVQFEAGAGALLDKAERVEDGVLNRGPSHNDGAIVRGGGVQCGCLYHYKQVQVESNEG